VGVPHERCFAWDVAISATDRKARQARFRTCLFGSVGVPCSGSPYVRPPLAYTFFRATRCRPREQDARVQGLLSRRLRRSKDTGWHPLGSLGLVRSPAPRPFGIIGPKKPPDHDRICAFRPSSSPLLRRQGPDWTYSHELRQAGLIEQRDVGKGAYNTGAGSRDLRDGNRPNDR